MTNLEDYTDLITSLREPEYPEYFTPGMGCGLEDNQINDPYSACRYGWDDAIGRVSEMHDGVMNEAATAIKDLASDIADLRNELCLKCGRYKTAHLGSCDGCRWRNRE